MRLHQFLRDGQAQPSAPRMPDASLGLFEWLEDDGLLVFGDAWPGIGHAEQNRIGRGHRLHSDIPRFGEFGSIRHQIKEHLPNPALVAAQILQAVTNLSLAVDQGYGDNTRTEWVRVTIWGEAQSSAAVKFLSKGDLVSVTSERFRVNAWASRDGSLRGQLEVTARRVDYILTKRQADDSPTDEAPADSIPF